jgi:ATP-dependent DNA helicase RecQ
MPKREIPDEVRQFCLERDGFACQWKGCALMRSNGARLNLHHVLPEQFGGTETPDNLITLCDIHHKNMHSEFSAYYPDSQNVLLRMNDKLKVTLSKFYKVFGLDDGNDLLPYLQFLTGKKEFREGQLKVIRAALDGKNVLFVAPTGSGKSVCYQLPGLLGNDPTLVISPLKALMKDQVESIWGKMIPATFINSDIGSQEKRKRYGFIRKHLYKFIFVAPERFGANDPEMSSLYNSYSYFVVDEAHSIETWGKAFRPSYRKLGELRKKLNNPPVLALTATASKTTQEAILNSLGATDAERIVIGVYKDNIEIRKTIRSSSSYGRDQVPIWKHAYIKKLIRDNPDQKFLIFAPTISKGNELLGSLQADGVEVEFYHSKLEAKQKMEIQNRFSGLEKPGVNVLIATSSFGMGIDIGDIRHVVHLAPALSVTDYAQQIGRAGRDGKQSYAHLLYESGDIKLLEYLATVSVKSSGFKEMHGYSDEEVKAVEANLLQQVADMVELTNQPSGKEWEFILNYFGEVKPSFWQRYGIKILDWAIVVTTVLAVIVGLLIVFGFSVDIWHWISQGSPR